MLEYDQIDFSDGIDVNKTDSLRKCIICHYWYFLEISFEFHPEVYHGCHNLIQKARVLMMLQLLLLEEMIVESIFCI